MRIDIATLDDAQAIADVYAPYVSNTTVSFELTPPTAEEMSKRIAKTQEKFAYLVCRDENGVCGYAYAHDFRERRAYRFDTEYSIYLEESRHGKGIAAALYGALTEITQAQGYYRAYSSIAMPNDKSEYFHYKMGFERIAVFKETGYKMGRWIDLLWLEKLLKPAEFFAGASLPQEPKKLSELDKSFVEAILAKYSEKL